MCRDDGTSWSLSWHYHTPSFRHTRRQCAEMMVLLGVSHDIITRQASDTHVVNVPRWSYFLESLMTLSHAKLQTHTSSMCRDDGTSWSLSWHYHTPSFRHTRRQCAEMIVLLGVSHDIITHQASDTHVVNVPRWWYFLEFLMTLSHTKLQTHTSSMCRDDGTSWSFSWHYHTPSFRHTRRQCAEMIVLLGVSHDDIAPQTSDTHVVNVPRWWYFLESLMTLSHTKLQTHTLSMCRDDGTSWSLSWHYHTPSFRHTRRQCAEMIVLLGVSGQRSWPSHFMFPYTI